MLTHPARPDKNTDLISVGYSITKSQADSKVLLLNKNTFLCPFKLLASIKTTGITRTRMSPLATSAGTTQATASEGNLLDQISTTTSKKEIRLLLQTDKTVAVYTSKLALRAKERSMYERFQTILVVTTFCHYQNVRRRLLIQCQKIPTLWVFFVYCINELLQNTCKRYRYISSSR